MSPDPQKAAKMKAANAAADAAPAKKASRKPHPAAARKAAAVEAYTKEYGRTPAGRMSAARLEKSVWNAQQTRIRVDNNIKAISKPAARPAARSAPAPQPQPSYKPMTTWDMVSGNTHGEPIRTSKPTPWRVPDPYYEPPARSSSGDHRFTYLDDHVTDTRSRLTKGMVGVGVGAAAVQGYLQARDSGDNVGVAAVKGAMSAAPQAFVAFAPQMEKAGQFLKEVGYGTGKAVLDNYDIGTNIMDGMLLDRQIAKTGLVAGMVGVGGSVIEKAAKVAGKFALPASLAVGGVIGAMKDENRLRGAGRGMVSALDPTALFMKKGLAERGFNAVFGEQDRPIGQQPRMNQHNPATDDYRGKGGLTRHSEARLSAPAHFAAANEAFRAGRVKEAQKAEANGNHNKGFQNPQNLYAALRARNASTDNVANF